MIGNLLLIWIITPVHGNTSPLFRHLDSDHGLSQNSVWSVAQDARGFIWIATSYGLNRYDGKRMKTYLHEPENPNSLSGHQCRTLFLDKNGILWIGTSSGLNSIDPETEKITRYNIDLRFITTLAQGPDGSIWLGAIKGLFIVDPKTASITRKRNENTPFNSVRSLVSDGDRLWIGAKSGLHQFNHKTGAILTWRHEDNNPNSLSANSIREITLDSKGALWIATESGLDRLDPISGAVTRYKSELMESRDNFINTVICDEMDRIWFGSMKDGLNCLNPETGQVFTYRKRGVNDREISSDDITSLFIDQSNLLWIGTFDSGLSILSLNPSNFYTLDFPEAPRIKDVRTFYEDTASRLWVGTEHGLFTHDPQKHITRHFTHQQDNNTSLTDNQVLTITQFMDQIWVGTYSGGACRFNEKTMEFEQFGHIGEESVSYSPILKLLADKNHNLWAGTLRGLEKFNPKAGGFEEFRIGEENDRDRVQAIFEDSNGNLWIGTEKSGVIIYHPNRQIREPLGNFRERKGQANRINAITESEAGEIWVGSMAGLSRLGKDHKQTELYTMNDGLPGNIVYSIIPYENDLWLSTNRGVVHFTPDKPQTGIRVFDISDGLQGHDFFRGAGLKSATGAIYFGGFNGANYFDPKTMSLNNHIPPITLTAIKVFDKDYSIRDKKKGLVLNYTQNHFSLEFASLDFHAPLKNQYSYKLEGYDKEWIHVGNRSQTRYTNLPGGTYTFRVKGSNNHGFWNETGYSLKVKIIPPLWKETWFIALGFLLAGILMYVIHRVRHRALKQRNETLEYLVKERTLKLENTRQNLLGIARRSGIFEITHGVLGQVEQILPDIRKTVEKMMNQTESLNPESAKEAVALLETATDPNAILDAKQADGIPDRLHELEDKIEKNQSILKDSATELIDHIARMRKTISVQHIYAKDKKEVQEIDICSLIDDALQLERAHILNAEVKVHKYYRAHPVYATSRIKLLHVLVQIIRNATEALEQAQEKVLGIRVLENSTQILIFIADTGPGLSPEIKKMAASDGYTTKPGHTGFGLYTCMKTMSELGGNLTLESGKDGKGAMVSLTLPRR